MKKTPLSEYLKADEKGLADLRLLEKDAVARALISLGGGDYVVTTSDARTVRFSDADLRPVGRVGQGVQGVNLAKGATVVGADWIADDDDRELWVATSNGWIKRTPLADYPRKGRATGGVSTIQLTEHASVVGAAVLGPAEDVLLVSDQGVTRRLTPAEVPLLPRDRKGRAAFDLQPPDRVARVVVLPS